MFSSVAALDSTYRRGIPIFVVGEELTFLVLAREGPAADLFFCFLHCP